MMMRGRGHGPGAMGGGDEKANNFKATMIKLAQYMRGHRLKLIFVVIFAVLSTIFNIIGPKVLGNATTAVFEGAIAEMSGTGSIDFAYIGQILGTMLILYLFSSLFAYLMGYIMAGVSTDITYRLRQEISQKMNHMPLSYFDKTSQGEVLSRITNDVDTVNQTLSQSLTQIITSVITVVGVLIMMLSISPLLTLASLVVIPITLGVVGFIIKRSQVYFRAQQEYLGHVNGHVEEMFGGHRVMKAFNGEERSIAQFEEYNDTLYAAGWKSQFYTGLMMPIMNFIGNLGYVIVVVVGSYLAIGGTITVGDIQAFIQYVRQFNQPLAQLANISNILQQTADDGELGVLLNDDYSAAAYSLLQVRYYLGYLLHMGVARTDVSAAFEKIAAAYFMLRSAAFIEDTIRSLLESQHARSNWWQIGSPVFDLKGMDLERALRQELRLGPPMPRVNMQWMRLGLSLGLPDRAPRWC